MAATISFHSEIPVKYRPQVLVVGAGPGGIAAAVSAARQGAEVLLLESRFLPGGLSTAGRVPILMPFSDGERILCGGFGAEVIKRLQARAQLYGFESGGALNAEHLKLIYEDLLGESGAVVLYGCRLCAVEHEAGHVKAAVFASVEGLFAVEAAVYIDGTGDGILASWAGAEYAAGGENGEWMPSTLCSLWAGFDWKKYLEGKAFGHDDDNMLALLDKAFAAGELQQTDYHHTGLTRISTVAAAGNVSHEFDVNPYSVESVSQALIRARKRLVEYERFYRKHIKGFEHAEIIGSGSMLGIREGRRIIGDYVLNVKDFEARATFPDEIGRYNFSADIHPPRPGRKELEEHKRLFQATKMKRGESYGVPYRILLPAALNNVLICGRCVSTDRHLYASLRVIPGSYITGQAAGIAAAIAAESRCEPRRIDIGSLRSRLSALGVYMRG